MEHRVDPLVQESVTEVRNRFGADGLRDLIALAQQELTRTETALAELAAYEATAGGQQPEA